MYPRRLRPLDRWQRGSRVGMIRDRFRAREQPSRVDPRRNGVVAANTIRGSLAWSVEEVEDNDDPGRPALHDVDA
jgi:hypothetical protein